MATSVEKEATDGLAVEGTYHMLSLLSYLLWGGKIMSLATVDTSDPEN